MKSTWWAIRYAWLTTKHKWFVFLAGRHTGASTWRLLTHDLSKYGSSELFAYGRQFFGDHSDPLGFSYAWLHHQRKNKHHWEAWVPVTGHNRGGYEDLQPLPMPFRYACEMVADWIGASRAYEGKWPADLDSWGWWKAKFPATKLHETTRLVVRTVAISALASMSRN
jgi:hypothetical protein